MWAYRETCIQDHDLEGILKQRWDADGFSWTVPEQHFTSIPGCRNTSYGIITPELSFDRDVIYNSIRQYRINPIRTVQIQVAGIPITLKEAKKRE